MLYKVFLWKKNKIALKKTIYRALCTIFVCFYCNLAGYAQTSWQFEFLPGMSSTLPSNLLIVQENQPEIRLRANYNTFPLKLPFYYSYRLSHYTKSGGWELELNHLKIVLSNSHQDIQRFSITHGYNLIWVNKTWVLPHFYIRTGIGTIAAHAENTIRNQKLDESLGLFNKGYYLGGISAQLAIQYKLFLLDFLYLSAEAKIAASNCKVPVVDGYAKVPVFHQALHLGIGFRFKKNKVTNQ